MWTDDSIESQAKPEPQIRRLGPMSPTHSKHELYRNIQKGGSIPEHGLQLSTTADRKGGLSLYHSWYQGSHTSWKVLEKYLENYAFFIGCNGKQAEIVNVPVCVDFYFYLFLKTTTVNILLHATVSAMDYTPNVMSKRCFFFIFKHSWAPKRSWKICHGGPGKSWKSPGFFPVKEWEPCDMFM